MFEYRLLPTPTASKKAKGLKTVPDRFAHALTEALNTEAKNGWDFVGQETFSVEEKSGMMKKTKSTELTYLVFKRSIVSDSVPLDQKLENLRSKRDRTVVQATPTSMVPVMTPESGPTPQAAEMPEPFPEPMPTYVPEEPHEEARSDVPEVDTSRSLPFPGPAPAKTLGMTGGSEFGAQLRDKPTQNYNHSKGASTDASVDVPVLGPAKRD